LAIAEDPPRLLGGTCGLKREQSCAVYIVPIKMKKVYLTPHLSKVVYFTFTPQL
jgi:hypothetical protein